MTPSLRDRAALAIAGTMAVLLAGSGWSDAGAASKQPAGSLDRAFSSDGQLSLLAPRTLNGPFSEDGLAPTGFLGAQRRNLVVGALYGNLIQTPGSLGSIALSRDGRRDTRYGRQGFAVARSSVALAYPSAMVTSRTSTTFAASLRGAGYKGSGVVVSRVGSRGRPVSRFGTNGEVVTRLPGDDVRLAALASTPDDGAVVAASRASTSGPRELVVVKYLPSGALDVRFGSGGVAPLDPSRIAGKITAIRALSSGEIVLAASLQDMRLPQTLLIAKLRPDGNFDTSFASAGILQPPLRTQGTIFEAPSVSTIVPDSRGRLLLAGRNSGRGFLYRVSRDGRPDASFVDRAAARLKPGSALAGAQIDARGRIVVGGTATGKRGEGSHLRLLVARFTTGGRLDSSFGSGGQTVTRFARSVQAIGVELTPPGRIVVAGATDPPATGNARVTRFVLARYTSARQ